MSEYEEKDEVLEAMKALSIKEQGELFVALKGQIDEQKKAMAIVVSKFDKLRLVAMPQKLEEMGLDNVKISGVGRVSITADAYVSVKAGQKEALFNWMRENDHESLITEVVNSSTLKAFIKEQIREGNEIPGDDIVNFTPFDRASVTKA